MAYYGHVTANVASPPLFHRDRLVQSPAAEPSRFGFQGWRSSHELWPAHGDAQLFHG